MSEQVRASAVWRESVAIIVRHPLATVAPALLLAPLSEAPHLLPDRRSYLELALLFSSSRWLSTSTWRTRSA
jgi:hypothetical protein